MTHTLAILGAGVMGAGIATLAIGRGVPVILVDLDEDVLTAARERVDQQLRLGRLMGRLPREVEAAGLVTSTDLAAIAPATAVVESVTEHPDRKVRVLTQVSGVVAPGTPIVTNTSAVPVDELAEALARPADFLGVHFMNPPYLVEMVEVVRGPRTGDAALVVVLDLLTLLGKKTVVVGDGPGFVINRVLQRMINEAARIVQDGVAAPAEVDALFTGCLGHTTGPLGTADLIGLDNVVDSLHVLLDRTGDEGYRPCELLVAKVKAGDHGRKTGRGFFEYSSGGPSSVGRNAVEHGGAR
ncbi:3-hydroxyacyl-CoA dehydrogenase family protein [Actinokineospora sp. NBRC 105648]|uniref:3-hydroxyacyl-CoA dehydrogenase family protein n=1 Tax=Actinokineospora sp. NBRC 105648 TaxID=3032206 RepID=UPI0024A0273F|nr:3-hydroxyacyl-CoA dehydrogenase family protein [Actinokineospora sp. NBRC 105648]GLZ39699.1 3-hydroxybutyryl-CoA dehydrogenase [Actinokineospora sp. NBRC 105648]